MVPRTMFLTLCSILVLVLSATAQPKKYDIKSGVITFDQATILSGMTMRSKIVVTFDEYGMKERKETYNEGVLDEVFFSDAKDLYLLKPASKAAYKRGSAYRGTELKFDWDEVSSRDKKEGKAKQLPSRTVAGKKCEAFQHQMRSTTTVFAGWKGITLYTEVKSSGMTITTKAVTVEENIAVPPSKFQIPSGYKVE